MLIKMLKKARLKMLLLFLYLILRKEAAKMVAVYVTLILKGLLTIDDVLPPFKDKVQEALDALN